MGQQWSRRGNACGTRSLISQAFPLLGAGGEDTATQGGVEGTTESGQHLGAGLQDTRTMNL